jgi:hypothetical protein
MAQIKVAFWESEILGNRENSNLSTSGRRDHGIDGLLILSTREGKS